jgi:CRP-like cAMP-binding protein
MPFPTHSARPCNSRLLSLLSAKDYQSLLPQLELVPTAFKQVLYERGQPIPYVYFPCNTVHSVLAFMQDGAAVEVGTIGNEGFTGIGVFIGSGAEIATETTLCQIAGDNLRMSACDFHDATTGDTPLRRLASRYVPAYLSQISQSVACNRLHTIEERFARWVLMTQDRVESDEFHLTQEFLADMLGTHRPCVSLVAGIFQQAGLITYSRGKMTILNRAGLEQTSCECYGIVKKQFQRLLGLERG